MDAKKLQEIAKEKFDAEESARQHLVEVLKTMAYSPQAVTQAMSKYIEAQGFAAPWRWVLEKADKLGLDVTQAAHVVMMDCQLRIHADERYKPGIAGARQAAERTGIYIFLDQMYRLMEG